MITKLPLSTNKKLVINNIGLMLDSLHAEIPEYKLLAHVHSYILKKSSLLVVCNVQDQYVFIHDAILESVTCGDTQIKAENLRRQIQKMSRVAPGKTTSEFQYQFKILEQVTPNPDEVNCTAALKNKDLNRGTKYLPSECIKKFSTVTACSATVSILSFCNNRLLPILVCEYEDSLPNTQMKTGECFSKDKNMVMTISMLYLSM